MGLELRFGLRPGPLLGAGWSSHFLSQYVSPADSRSRHIFLGRRRPHAPRAWTTCGCCAPAAPGPPPPGGSKPASRQPLPRQLALLTWTRCRAANALSGDVWNIDNNFLRPMAGYGVGLGIGPDSLGESPGLWERFPGTEMPVHHLPLLTNLLVFTITLRLSDGARADTPHTRPRAVVGEQCLP